MGGNEPVLETLRPNPLSKSSRCHGIPSVKGGLWGNQLLESWQRLIDQTEVIRIGSKPLTYQANSPALNTAFKLKQIAQSLLFTRKIEVMYNTAVISKQAKWPV